MRRSVRVLLLPGILVALGAAGAAQGPFRTETTVVRVDVVVRHADGTPVEDLDALAFEVLEAGIRQPIVWFERGPGGAPAASSRPAAGAATAAPHGWDAAGDAGAQSLVALVFHELSAQSRLDATRAATAMADGLPPGEFAAVFLIDQAMTEVIGFTRDREALRQAIQKVAMTPPAFRPPGPLGAAEMGGPGGGGSPAHEQQMAMKARMAGGDVVFEAGVQGGAFSQLVRALDRFPGRRAVVLFSEGLAMPDVAPRLEAVVDAAAPRHVSFYTIDAVGFGTGGRRDQAPRRRLEASELTSVSRETDRRPAKIAEMDRTLGLRPLAELTGGLYLSDSNDVAALLARANADRRAFYVLGYRTNAPAPEAGTRPIEVRVTHPGFSVRARTRMGQQGPAAGQPAYDRTR